MAGVPGRDKGGKPGQIPNPLSTIDPTGNVLQQYASAPGVDSASLLQGPEGDAARAAASRALGRVDRSATIDTSDKTAPNKSTPAAFASIIEAPVRQDDNSGLSERLDLGKWAYDEVKCAPPRPPTRSRLHVIVVGTAEVSLL